MVITRQQRASEKDSPCVISTNFYSMHPLPICRIQDFRNHSIYHARLTRVGITPLAQQSAACMVRNQGLRMRHPHTRGCYGKLNVIWRIVRCFRCSAQSCNACCDIGRWVAKTTVDTRVVQQGRRENIATIVSERINSACVHANECTSHKLEHASTHIIQSMHT